METKILIIAVIESRGRVLMRQKRPGSPYRQTWYLFGTEFQHGKDPARTLEEAIKGQIGITIRATEAITWDAEVKRDHDGTRKQFLYLSVRCKHVSGTPVCPTDAESIGWVRKSELQEYDLVPPTEKLFKRLGWL